MPNMVWKYRRICAYPNCSQTAQCSGFCNRHYNRRFFRGNSWPTTDGLPCPICGENIRNLGGHMKFHHHVTLREWNEEHGVTCSAEDCDDPVLSKGLCAKHYNRYKRVRAKMRQ